MTAFLLWLKGRLSLFTSDRVKFGQGAAPSEGAGVCHATVGDSWSCCGAAATYWQIGEMSGWSRWLWK